MAKNLFTKVALIGSLAFAYANADIFVGVESGVAKSEEVLVAPNIGIKVGKDFDKYRVYGGYNYTFKARDKEIPEIGIAFHDIVVGADLIPKVGDNLKFLIGGYMGLSYGKIKPNIDGDLIRVEVNKSQTGFLIGAKTGLIYEIGKSQVEFGAKFDNTTWSGGGQNRKFGAYLGYNHKF